MKLKQLFFAAMITFFGTSSWAHLPDVTCGDQLFSITRTDGLYGDLFLWKFSGHLLEHLMGNNVLTQSTRIQTGAETFSRIYFSEGTAGISTGATFENFTKTGTILNNRGRMLSLKLVSDNHSKGYFLRAFQSGTHEQIAEYYFKECDFGENYKALPNQLSDQQCSIILGNKQ